MYENIIFATDMMCKEGNMLVSSFIEAFLHKLFKIGIKMVTKNYQKAKLELTVHSQL